MPVNFITGMLRTDIFVLNLADFGYLNVLTGLIFRTQFFKWRTFSLHSHPMIKTSVQFILIDLIAGH